MAIKTDEEIFNDYCNEYFIDNHFKIYHKKELMNTYHFLKYRLSVRWSEFIQSLKNEISKYFKKHLDNK